MPIVIPPPARLHMSEEQTAYAIRCLREWLAFKNENDQDEPELARLADVLEDSTLFHRLMEGIDPLPYPPPISFGESNYAAATSESWPCTVRGPLAGEADTSWAGQGKHLLVDDAQWRLVSESDGPSYYARYYKDGPLYRFYKNPSVEDAWFGVKMPT